MRESRKNLCNEDCNNCPIIMHPNSRMLTKVLNRLLDVYGDGVYSIVQDLCPNFTVCYDCRIADFCHIGGDEENEGCTIIDSEAQITQLKRKLKINKIEE